MVVANLPGLSNEVRDLDDGELTQSLHLTGDLDRDGVLDARPSHEHGNRVKGKSVVIDLRSFVANSMTGSAGPAAANLIEVVSMGSRMVSPFEGRTIRPSYESRRIRGFWTSSSV